MSFILIKLPLRKPPRFPFLIQLKRSWLERESFNRFERLFTRYWYEWSVVLKGYHWPIPFSKFWDLYPQFVWRIKEGHLVSRCIDKWNLVWVFRLAKMILSETGRVITLRLVTTRAKKGCSNQLPISQFLSANSQWLVIGWWFQKTRGLTVEFLFVFKATSLS